MAPTRTETWDLSFPRKTFLLSMWMSCVLQTEEGAWRWRVLETTA